MFNIIYCDEMEQEIISLSSVHGICSEFGNVAKISQVSMCLYDLITLNMPNTHPNVFRRLKHLRKRY